MKQKVSGVYYFKKRILRFQSSENLISDDDITNLFMGFVRFLKSNIERKVEKKYFLKIAKLEKELDYIKQVKNVN